MRGRSVSLGGIRIRSYFFEEAGKNIQYAVYVPKKRDAAKSPLVIALHGRGVPPELMLRELTAAAKKGGYIVAAPMGYDLRSWYGAPPLGSTELSSDVAELSEKDVLNVLELMRKEFDVDERRIYLVGQSMGGAGALHLGIKYRDIWAAIAATAPAIPDAEPSGLESIRGMPVMLVHGDADRAVAVERTRRWAGKMQELGMVCEYLEIKGGEHGSAIRVGAPHVFEFFDKHSKPEGKSAADPEITQTIDSEQPQGG